MNILIIGATGSLGRTAVPQFLSETNDHLTLFSRRAGTLSNPDPERVTIIEGDVLDVEKLDEAMTGQEAVFASLSGNLAEMAEAIIKAMKKHDVNRLIFISSMGIYNEIAPGVWPAGNLDSNPTLISFRETADYIETTDINYTIIRGAWFDNTPAIDYEVTLKGEPFPAHDISRSSIIDLVIHTVHDSKLYSRESVGIHRPGT